MTDERSSAHVVALCGGVGGAKLALGLCRVLPPGKLTLIVNTGDDFRHLGLHVSPDIDTVVYTLSDLVDPERGWGRRDESWAFMAELGRLGAETWFQLGDRDLAMHVERSAALDGGVSLTAFTGRIARQLGIPAQVLPMSDSPVRTMVLTDGGELEFQRYFVERRCAPVLRGVRFAGAEGAEVTGAVREALSDPGLGAVILCPSNPYLSIDPILAVGGMRELLGRATAPRIAVSPIIGGKAVKGPTDKIMAELGIPGTSRAIADHYAGLIDGLVVDEADGADAVSRPDLAVMAVPTLMTSLEDKKRLAANVLDFAGRIGRPQDGRAAGR